MSSTASSLPTATACPDQALDDLRTAGVAILSDVFDTDLVTRARDRLTRIAAHERTTGTAVMDDGRSASGELQPGANQRVVSLLEKDALFGVLGATPTLVELAGRRFAESYGYPDDVIDRLDLDAVLLSSVTANVATNGGHEMSLHSDQGFVPPSITVPVLLNVVVPLVDFTADNGATRVAPLSHLADPRLLFDLPPETTPIEARAGSVILLDGRTWHGTGANRTTSSRPALLINYCPPWVRPFDRPTDATIRRLRRSPTLADQRLAVLRGSRRWFVYGANP